MPFTTKEIDKFTESPPDANELLSYRMACAPYSIQLPAEMAAALGAVFGRRQLTPFAAVAVDVIAAKLEIDRDALKVAGATETKAVKSWLSDGSFACVERELWRLVVRDGRAFLRVNWRVPDASNPDYEEPGPDLRVVQAWDGQCGAAAMDGWAFNSWEHEGTRYFDAYFPDRVEKYIRPAGEKKEWLPRVDEPGEEWPTPWTTADGSPLGVALIEFSIGASDIAAATQISRDLNDAVLDLLAMSRTQGWPQRYIKGGRNSDVVTNGLGQPIISPHTQRPIKKQVVLAPGSILQLNDESEIGQLSGATPNAILIDKLLELLSFVTAVPSHYFSGTWPSGVALQQAEQRLNHKVEEHQGRLSQPMAKTIALMMRLSNHFAGTRLKTNVPITIPWHPPQVETEDVRLERERATRATASELFEKGLMTLKTALKTIHPDWTQEQIDAEAAELSSARREAGVIMDAPMDES